MSPTSSGPTAPPPFAADAAAQWALDPAIAFMNHGCFGARLRAVLEAQSRLRAQYEARPVEFLDRKRAELIAAARSAVASFIGAEPRNLGFVTNATTAVNAVMRSLKFQAGDELLTTNHVYNAVRMTMRHLAQRAGARYIEAQVPLPLRIPEQVIGLIESAMTDRTRLLVIDHITSPTAVVFPVQRLVKLCAARGIDVLIDGAHAPGMLPLDIEQIGAAYYAGNLHKWVCAPSGAGFLWVRPDRQQDLHPTTISHFLDESFAKEFEWQGTRDITPWLCAPVAIECLSGMHGGWERVMQHNHELATWVQAMLCRQWSVEPATPLDGSMLGSMATVSLPRQQRYRERFSTIEALQAQLYDRFKIEVPVIDWDGTWWVRPCCQIYNTAEQYERLADAVLELAE